MKYFERIFSNFGFGNEGVAKIKQVLVAFISRGDAKESIHQAKIKLKLQFLAAHLVIAACTDSTLLTKSLYAHFQPLSNPIDELKKLAIS